MIRSIPDESTRAAALKRGDVDVVYYLNGPIAEDVRRTPGLTLAATRTNGVLWLEFPEQWTPGSPWADRRVRLAASLAIDRQAINEAESLGFSGPTGNIVPRHQEFALPIDPHPVRSQAARRRCWPRPAIRTASTPASSRRTRPTPRWARRSSTTSRAVGIKTRMRTMERAAFLSAWRDKKLRGRLRRAPPARPATPPRASSRSRPAGASTPTGCCRTSRGLFQRQLQEMDRKKREELLHQIQRLLADRVVFAPIWENGFIRAYRAAVEEAGLSLIQAFPYSGPLEDVARRPARAKPQSGPCPLDSSEAAPANTLHFASSASDDG